MSCNLVFYNSSSLLRKILLSSSVAGITDGLCLLVFWETREPITLSLKRIGIGCISGYHRSYELLGKPLSTPTACPWAGAQLCVLWVVVTGVTRADYRMHVYNVLARFPAYTVVPPLHTVSGWGGSKQGYLCCHDNSEATPCFFIPNPPTRSVQNKALERGAGWWYMHWCLTWAEGQEKKCIIYLLLIDLSSRQHLS